VAEDAVVLRGGQAARRQLIIDEAFRLILASENENVQIREVADGAGVALGTAYRYFKSKDRLFAEAYEMWVRGHAEAIKLLARRAGSNQERVRLIALELFDLFSSEPQFIQVGRQIAPSTDPEVQAIMWRCQQHTLDLFTDVVDDVEPEHVKSISVIVTTVIFHAIDRVASGEFKADQARRMLVRCVGTLFEFHEPVQQRSRRAKAAS
jgi:AcrR family transcriptional regulator